MQSFLLLTLAAVAAARPNADADQANNLSARDVGPGVFYCLGSRFSGYCHWELFESLKCFDLPDADQLSLGPDIGIQCLLHAEHGCKDTGTGGNLVYPGRTSFDGYQGLTGPPKSYQCKACVDPQCGKAGVEVYPWGLH